MYFSLRKTIAYKIRFAKNTAHYSTLILYAKKKNKQICVLIESQLKMR